MGMRETVLTKLQQATCDKPELNRQFLRLWRSFQDVEKVLEDGGKGSAKRKTGNWKH